MELLEIERFGTHTAEPCRVGQILAAVTEAQRKLIEDRLVNSSEWSADKLAFGMKKTSYHVGATTIKLHRRKMCGCFL